MKREQKNNKPTILAVDDYEPNLIALEAVLNADYNLISVKSGHEALAHIIAGDSIDLILMDVQMPEMDGYETAAEIKKIISAEDIPIIFITAVFKEDPFIKKGYAAGGVDYFSKPFDPDILKMKVSIYASFRQKILIANERAKNLKDSEDLLSTGRKLSEIFKSLRVGVIITDVEGHICQINEQVSRICNSPEKIDVNSYREMLGWWDASGKMIEDKNIPLLRALQLGETTHSERIKNSSLKGINRDVLCSASPLLGLDGKIVGAALVIQDLTESKKIEEALEKRITKLFSSGIELVDSDHMTSGAII